MAKKSKDFSIEEKLINVLTLQKIDSKIDQLNIQKGELPMEVSDLEDEVEGIEVRVQNIQKEINKVEAFIQSKIDGRKEAEMLIAKYEKQQDNVKNSREFQALTKEVELQTLEIRLCDKNIRESEAELARRKDNLLSSTNLLEGKKELLVEKQKELDEIITETEKEEKELSKQSIAAMDKVEGYLQTAYTRIRQNFRNGLAVVPIERDSCGGCYNFIPPQRQADIALRKKIIVCEHCGRLLVDDELFEKVNP